MSVDHYENFPVASLLCPPALRPPIVAIYRFARTADDIADEGDAAPGAAAGRPGGLPRRPRRGRGRPARRRRAGRRCSGRWPRRSRAHRLPVDAARRDLLDAFEQDVDRTRYADRAELLDYCRRSANPVGRLLLHLYGVDDAARWRRSDAICTALQLINFWQDLGVDTRAAASTCREADCRRHGVDPLELLARRDSAAVRALVADARRLGARR